MLSIHLRLGLPSDLFPSGLPTNNNNNNNNKFWVRAWIFLSVATPQPYLGPL
jgi:hypothetical protein